MLGKNGHEVMYTGLYETKENELIAKDSENIDLGGKRGGFSIKLLLRLMKLIKTRKPDIIQANGSDTLKYSAIAKFFYPHMNIVYRNISMVSARTRPGSFRTKMNSLLFKKVDRVTSVGNESLGDLIKTFGYPSAKARVMRRGIPELNFEHTASKKKIAEEFDFPVSDFVLMYTAQFSPEKNQEFLIDSFEKVLAEGFKARMLFVGMGERMEEMKAIVAEKKLNKHILFTGYRKNVPELLAGSDVFVFGSKIEGVPGALLEAGMQSLPVVAVSTGGVSETMLNGKTGILLDKHDPAEFARAIISLLENETMRRSFGEQGKQFVMENFSLQSALRNFENLYAEILKEKNQRAG
jgi:glycosyltransferase involved in cell wall biosynthesis